MVDLEAEGAGSRFLSIVAHEDDDLLFQSPELMETVRSGRPSLTLFVTAGEANGDLVSREHYAAERQAGIRAAYAEAAGVADDWNRSTAAHAGRVIEIAELDGRPDVQVMFVCLPDGGDSLHPDALPGLLQDPTRVEPTILPDGSPVAQTFAYRQDDLLAVLVAVMAEFGPTVVRIADTSPAADLTGDHGDHIAVARFARLAIAVHEAGGARVTLIEHRGYNIQPMPTSLSPGRSAEKAAIFQAYRDHDVNAVGSPPEWLTRFYRKWENGADWATLDDAGRIHAFAIQGGAVRHWRQQAPGGPWAAPSALDPLELAPALAVGRHADGRIAVFGVDVDSRNLFTSRQLALGGGFSGWVDLGNHSDAENNLAPAVVPNEDGRLQVFLRNSGTGLSTIWETTGGAWSDWRDFGQVDLQGTPAALLRPDGLAFVAMATRATIRSWSQDEVNGGWASPVIRVGEGPSNSPTVVLGPDDRLHCFFRDGNGAVCFAAETSIDGDFGDVDDLGGDDGVGVIAALRADGVGVDGRIFLAQRTLAGGIQVTWQVEPDDEFEDWVDLGGMAIGTPALVADADGLPVVLMHAANGSMHVAELTGTAPIAWGDWAPAGG
jgi:LmbE family N-acetylglucosaminyl deacetylase